jgi:hypothetical protein
MSQGDPDVLNEHKLVKRRTWRLEEFAFVGLIGFSIIGEYVGNVSPTISFWYWVVMIPAFAIVAIITEWSQARADGIPPPKRDLHSDCSLGRRLHRAPGHLFTLECRSFG